MNDLYAVTPLSKPPVCTVQVPGSKSITNRALILAALAQPAIKGPSYSQLENALRSEDTEVMVESLQRLGIAVHTDWESDRITVPCAPVSQWKPHADFFCGNSGTTIRFLTAMLSLGNGSYRLDGVERMRQRPIGDLLEALRALHVNISTELRPDCPPLQLNAAGLHGGVVSIRSDISSQFLSALLMASCYAHKETIIHVPGALVSQPYVQLTIQMMKQWGVDVEEMHDPDLSYRIKLQRYTARTYAIEPDASSASYFWAAAAITGGRVTVPGLADSMQGDAAFRHVLKRMGCTLPDQNTVQGTPLTGIDIDMNAISDTVMTLAVVALFAQGTTTIRNVAHIRHKETDRLAALASELRKTGAIVDEHPDGLTIHPRPLHGAVFDTYNDHRMAMSLALIGLRIPGVQVRNPGCTAKTYPRYWQDLENLRQ
ncbi:MAG: 3-phosphoshikimate 1-carboxyvinyltransferase [Planctomycetia bacterium]|nr:3-phosphoshikimate 1-carboxyvinyltransferase [Planctomycetia bacterium]